MKLLLLLKQKTEGFAGLAIVNAIILLFQTIYISLRFEYLNDVIPILYTKNWGGDQLADKITIYYIPLASLLITLIAIYILFEIRDHFYLYLKEIVFTFLTAANILLTFSAVRIIMLASLPFPPLINPIYLDLVLPFIGAFVLVYLITPKAIEKFKDIGIITNPEIHQHPGMLLKAPSARGGGLIFALVVIFCGIIFIGLNDVFIYIYVTLILLALLGLLDDYQNSNIKTMLRFFENPLLRLLALTMIISIPVLGGIQIKTIGNPFDGIIDLGTYGLSFGNMQLPWLAVGISILWFIWVMNTLSWSNGVDGQYGGIVGIAGIMIALLALRFTELETIHIQMAQLGVITAGASFGLIKYTWYPSKIMWGFGAMTAGFVIAAAAILIGSKIAVAIIIILVPFLDAAVTIIRRILQRKNPLRGDSGHLHHLLLEHGWGVRRIATFYWITTMVFGLIGVISADRDVFLLTLTLGGIVATFIVGLNFSKQLRHKLLSPKPE